MKRKWIAHRAGISNSFKCVVRICVEKRKKTFTNTTARRRKHTHEKSKKIFAETTKWK